MRFIPQSYLKNNAPKVRFIWDTSGITYNNVTVYMDLQYSYGPITPLVASYTFSNMSVPNRYDSDFLYAPQLVTPNKNPSGDILCTFTICKGSGTLRYNQYSYRVQRLTPPTFDALGSSLNNFTVPNCPSTIGDGVGTIQLNSEIVQNDLFVLTLRMNFF